MNSGKYVFSQLVEFLPQKEFYKMLKRYNADKWTKTMSCWNQLLLMMFGQLSGCDSLRELACIVAAHQKKSYHIGFGKGIIAILSVIVTIIMFIEIWQIFYIEIA